MIEDRTLVEKFDNFINSSEFSNLNARTSPHGAFLKRLLIQSKQLSQIISYIWRWADEDINKFIEQVDTARSLAQYFVKPRETKHDISAERLKKLLGADPKRWLSSSEQDKENLPDKKEAKLLVAVFGEERIMNGIFPIFDEFELVGESGLPPGYFFAVNFSSFQGSIADHDKNTPGLLKFTIPYPPSPKFGDLTVTREELRNWIDNTDDKIFAADNPYIPATSS